MTEKQLDVLIDKASEKKVKACLKQIVSIWFVEDDTREVNFDKELNSDTLEAVTSTLQTMGFCPPEE
jgi:hypothetical protein